MSRINVLSKELSELIAAGEVIDRPSSVVKELLENSIDSGATIITVEIKNGGKSYIRITDNGDGIHKDDVKKHGGLEYEGTGEGDALLLAPGELMGTRLPPIRNEESHEIFQAN